MAFHIVKTQYTDKIRKVIRIILRVNSLCVASCIKQFKVWMPACVSKVCVVQCHNLVKASNSMFLTSVPCTFFFFFFLNFMRKNGNCIFVPVCAHMLMFVYIRCISIKQFSKWKWKMRFLIFFIGCKRNLPLVSFLLMSHSTASRLEELYEELYHFHLS